jgi:hypothetical protein
MYKVTAPKKPGKKIYSCFNNKPARSIIISSKIICLSLLLKSDGIKKLTDLGL